MENDIVQRTIFPKGLDDFGEGLGSDHRSGSTRPSWMAKRTSFVIAQRISTVLNADKILVLEDGAIVAEGTHRDLLTSNLIYREIYESQLGDGGEVDG